MKDLLTNYTLGMKKLTIALFIAIPFLYYFVLIPMYKECKEAGFSTTYCVNNTLID